MRTSRSNLLKWKGPALIHLEDSNSCGGSTNGNMTQWSLGVNPALHNRGCSAVLNPPVSNSDRTMQ